MTYPYIGELKSDNSGAVLFFRDSFGAQLSHKGSELRKDGIGVYFAFDDWNEDKFKNITTEYLANTCGEVKSKEHAEFIVKLAEVNGFTIEFISNFEAKSFIIKNECLSIFNIHINGLDKENLNKITIPLPPECYKPSIGGGGQPMDYINCRCSTAPVLNDEWPKVNDSVVLDDEDGIVKLPADAQDYYIVEVNGLYKQCKFGELSKPKTPEQELRDELTVVMQRNLTYDQIVTDLIDKYEIKKKPQ